MKRALDVTAALLGLIVSLPVLLVAMLAIRLETPGSPIFAQTRVGRGGRPFTCLKLRTMYKDTAHQPSHMTGASAVTPLGAKMRRWKLDELPQLWNVLVGQMSLVGPRPCLPTQTELVEARKRLGVLDVTPGITGLAQVQGVDMSEPEKLAAIDANYVKTATFVGDLSLIMATLSGKGVGVDRVAQQPTRH